MKVPSPCRPVPVCWRQKGVVDMIGVEGPVGSVIVVVDEEILVEEDGGMVLEGEVVDELVDPVQLLS
jgi:hypothetical protein